MKIEHVVSDLLSSNMYIITENNHSIVVDPCSEIRLPDNIVLDLIFLTHEHYDHICGVNFWREKYDARVICSQICNRNIQNPKQNLARYFIAFCGLQNELISRIPCELSKDYICNADNTFNEDCKFTWNEHVIQLMILPGHSPGSIGILIDNKFFFSGDSIFEDKETVLNFPGGSVKDWEQISLPKLRKLPFNCIVYPGHYNKFELSKWSEYREENE